MIGVAPGSWLRDGTGQDRIHLTWDESDCGVWASSSQHIGVKSSQVKSSWYDLDINSMNERSA